MFYRTTELKQDNEIFEKFTAYRVAKILGVSESYINRMKNGHVIPSEEKYLEIRAKLGLDTNG